MFGSKLIALCLLLAYVDQTFGSLPAKCLQPKVTGRCRAAMPRFYFNSATSACESFIYGGCGANENNFNTKEACAAECAIAPAAVNPCSLPAARGMCRGYFPRFYYDESKGYCRSFVYGGCQGNANNFVSEDDCVSKCQQDVCRLPLQVGPCKSRKNRFYFNSNTGACERFTYGGCRGNGNRFTTLAKCEAKCVPEPEYEEAEEEDEE